MKRLQLDQLSRRYLKILTTHGYKNLCSGLDCHFLQFSKMVIKNCERTVFGVVDHVFTQYKANLISHGQFIHVFQPHDLSLTLAMAANLIFKRFRPTQKTLLQGATFSFTHQCTQTLDFLYSGVTFGARTSQKDKKVSEISAGLFRFNEGQIN